MGYDYSRTDVVITDFRCKTIFTKISVVIDGKMKGLKTFFHVPYDLICFFISFFFIIFSHFLFYEKKGTNITIGDFPRGCGEYSGE
jgi:hypothetical protein